MTRRSRRRLLYGTAGLLTLSAGCLGGAGVPDDDNADADEDDSDENDPATAASAPADENAEADENGETDNGIALETYETVAFDVAWTREPNARLLTDADRARDWLADRGLEAADYTAFVDETSFDDSVLLALEAEGRSLEYELDLETVTVDDGAEPTLVVEAAVRGESSGMGGQQMIGVGRLVRATFADGPVTDASVTIVDADGHSHEQSLAVDSASESTGSEPDADDA